MRRATRRNLIRGLVYAALLGALCVVVWGGASGLRYRWDWGGFFSRWFPLLLQGLALTLKVAALSLCLALPLGVAVGLCRVARDPVARWVGTAYVEVVRGTPLLVQVMLWYFVLAKAFEELLAQVGLSVTFGSFGAAVAALSCFTASYIAEIVRAGIQSIDPGQLEAARSLGLSHFQALRTVILPQAIRRVLPPLASEFVALVKDSSLASVVGLEELTKRAQDVQGRAFLTFEVWIVAALLYLAINLLLSLAVRLLERKLGVAHRREEIR